MFQNEFISLLRLVVSENHFKLGADEMEENRFKAH